MEDYKTIPITELVRRWREKRLEIAKQDEDKRSFKDVSELFAMRKEIDRRKGDTNPTAEVNFEQDYLTD